MLNVLHLEQVGNTLAGAGRRFAVREAVKLGPQSGLDVVNDGVDVPVDGVDL
jgi:hypothetical protein